MIYKCIFRRKTTYTVLIKSLCFSKQLPAIKETYHYIKDL